MSEWKRIGLSKEAASSQVDWSDPGNLRGCDPYLVWNDHTGTDPSAAPTSGDNDRDALGSLDLVTVVIEHAVHQGQLVPPAQALHLHATHWHDSDPARIGRVRSYVLLRENLKDLVKEVREGRISRFELSYSRTRDVFGWLINFIKIDLSALKSFLGTRGLLRPFEAYFPQFVLPGLRLPDLPGLRTLQLPLGELSQKQAPSRRITTSNSRPVDAHSPMVAIIDDLCPFASPRLRLADGASAVRYLWDQGLDETTLAQRIAAGADLADHFRVPEPQASTAAGDGPIFDLGFELVTRPDRSGAGLPSTADLSEPDVYRRVGYVTTLRNWAHGTVVTHLIAGVAAGGSSPPEMIWVQLPDGTVNDTSGGSLSAHALDGIHYALERSAGRNVVVNLSYGTHAGPHDGTSIFETGLLDMLNRYPNLHVVLPAGNSHLLRTHSSVFLRRQSVETLLWKVMPDDPTDSYLELWIPSATGIQVNVRPPVGEQVTIEAGSACVWSASDGTVRAAVIFPEAVAQGRNGTMCLVALSPTRRAAKSTSKRNGADRKPLEAPHGVWKVTLSNATNEQVTVDAWIQRDDTAPGRGPRSRGQLGRQSYFLEGASNTVDPRTTLNGIATLEPHPRLRVVGAMRASDFGVSLYSSSGPNRGTTFRTTGPDVVAVGDHSMNLPGLLGGGTLGPSRRRVGGTSIAAAVVSGMWYRHLALGGSAESFYFFPVQAEYRQPETSPEGPERAPEWLRGTWERIELTESQAAVQVYGASAYGLPPHYFGNP